MDNSSYIASLKRIVGRQIAGMLVNIPVTSAKKSIFDWEVTLNYVVDCTKVEDDDYYNSIYGNSFDMFYMFNLHKSKSMCIFYRILDFVESDFE